MPDSPPAPAPPAPAPPAPAPLPAPVVAATARVFGALSAGRGARVFHPRGLVLRGTATLTGTTGALLAGPPPGPVPVIVRLSRGLGLRHPFPDFNGVAVKLPDAHGEGRDQDLLLVSSLRAPVARHVLLPVPTFATSGSSSILAYRTAGGLVMFGASPIEPGVLADVPAHLPVTFRLLAAPVLGRWAPAATVVLTERVPDTEAADRALAFDPWNTGAGLVPAGVLNRLRLPAYAASRAARPGRVRRGEPPAAASGSALDATGT